MNQFENYARRYKRTRRPSWEHTIKTYQGNNTKVDWFLIAGCLFLLAVGLGALSALI